jgi:hypothetical protein
MTGPCSGAGVGSARAGFSQLQFIAPSAIGGALAGLSGWSGAAVGAAIGSLAFDLSTFCPNGPNAMPVFTALDIIALLSPIPNAARDAAAGKFNDFLGNVFWPLLCQCSGVTTSTLGAPSAYPAGGPQGLLIGPPVPVCVAGSTFFHPNDNSVITGNPDPDLQGKVPTFVRLTVTVSGLLPGVTNTFNVSTLAGGVGALTAQIVTTSGQNGVVRVSSQPLRLDTTAVSWTSQLSGANVPPATVSAQMDYFCNGQVPGETLRPCCPPDPTFAAQVQEILDLVTLIQRQAVPFAYVPGAVHAGLNGAGTIAISGLLGVKVDVTTVPTPIGREGTTPVEYFDMGWISLGTPDGYPQSYRLEHNPQLLLPARCSANTTLAYDLHPGIVITVTELKREP